MTVWLTSRGRLQTGPAELSAARRYATPPSPYRLGSHRERTHLCISMHHVRGLLSRLSEWIVSYSDSYVRIIIFYFPPSPAVCAVTILSACTGHKQRWAHNCSSKGTASSGRSRTVGLWIVSRNAASPCFIPWMAHNWHDVQPWYATLPRTRLSRGFSACYAHSALPAGTVAR